MKKSCFNFPECVFQFTSLDSECQYLAVAGRTGLAHYSVLQRKWRLFGNETQEKDFIVTGGLVSGKDQKVHEVLRAGSGLEGKLYLDHLCKAHAYFQKSGTMPFLDVQAIFS